MATKEERQILVNKYRSLLRVCKPYLTSKKDAQILRKAYNLILDAYQYKKNETGEYFILHAVAVAKIVAQDIGLGITSIVCALMHDIIRDTDITVQNIKTNFGDTIAHIVKDLNKISVIDTERASLQPENFIELLFSLTDDVRVILIKLADRLNNMRTIDKRPPRKQKLLSSDTHNLYAPIAHRLGLYNIKTELEDRYLLYNHPDIYRAIAIQLKDTEKQRTRFINDFLKPIKVELEKYGFDFEIKSRTKSIFSIWQKMINKKVDFDEVYDLFAIRIIIKNIIESEKADCWKVYSFVTDIYQPNPKRLRDWITTPKDSGYESLHTTVKGPKNRWVEIQIRTKRMDEIAEKGDASHWKYKETAARSDDDKWLREIREKIESSSKYLSDKKNRTKINTVRDKIFVFTPLGDLKKLKAGSTVLDFAFEIHSNVGSKCTGAKVNNKIVPLKHILKNGDKVEIITSKKQKPKQDWLNIVVTSKAKSKIKQALKQNKFLEAEIGKDIIKRKFKNWKITYSDEVINKLINHYKLKSHLDFYYNVAIEKIAPLEIKKILTSQEEENIKPEKSENIQELPVKDNNKNYLIIDNTLDNVNYRFGKCCNPILGDDVFGFITIGRGITIHKNTCPNARRLKIKYPYRVLDVKWKSAKDKALFQAFIYFTGYDKMGIVSKITNMITNELKINMRSISVKSNDDNTFNGKIKVLVSDKEQLNDLINKIIKFDGVIDASRIDKFK